jgi:hypothetical protein
MDSEPGTEEEQQEESSGNGNGNGKTEAEQESDEAKEKIKQLEEEGPPEKLEDWPEDDAKYETFGGPEGEHGYHEGPEQQLGPTNLRHREDGSVEVDGEEVDDPESYKAEPVPGGPTDPDTPNLRMDKASPDDVSEVAQKASSSEGEGEGDSEGEGEGEKSGDEESESEQ